MKSKKRQETEPASGYVKIDRDPNKQAAALRAFFPGTGVNVFKPTAQEPKKKEP